MELYEFALNFERENYNFYLKCAEESKSKQLKQIFEYLAKEEKKHERIVMALQEGQTEEFHSDIMPRAKKVFEDIANEIKKEDYVYENDQIKTYRKAELMEDKSRDYYAKKAEEAASEDVKKVLLSLAKEEKRHGLIIDHILEHLERPEEWVEDAEFNKMETY